MIREVYQASGPSGGFGSDRAEAMIRGAASQVADWLSPAEFMSAGFIFFLMIQTPRQVGDENRMTHRRGCLGRSRIQNVRVASIFHLSQLQSGDLARSVEDRCIENHRSR